LHPETKIVRDQAISLGLQLPGKSPIKFVISFSVSIMKLFACLICGLLGIATSMAMQLSSTLSESLYTLESETDANFEALRTSHSAIKHRAFSGRKDEALQFAYDLRGGAKSSSKKSSSGSSKGTKSKKGSTSSKSKSVTSKSSKKKSEDKGAKAPSIFAVLKAFWISLVDPTYEMKLAAKLKKFHSLNQ
jgi:hypothetical protein